MGQRPRELEPTRSPLHFFGAELRRRREGCGLSQAELGRLLFQHRDLVRKVETAQRMPSEEFVGRCDDVLGADGALRRMWPMLAREARLRRGGDPHGGGYRAELSDQRALDWLLSRRRPGRRRADTQAGHHAELTLRSIRELDHACGGGAAYSAVAGVLEDAFDEVFATSPQVAAGLLELAGYEAVDIGADGLAQRHYLRALDVVTTGGDRLYGGYLVGVSLGHLALHCGDSAQAVRLATAALQGTARQAGPGVRAVLRTALARAHARRGEEAACVTALQQAEADLARRCRSDEPSWLGYFGEADLADGKAHCYFDLGHYDLARDEAIRALRLLPPFRVRRRAIDAALLASSLARTGDVAQACAAGRLAVAQASTTASFRAKHRVALMMAELHPYANLPEVLDLIERVRTSMPSPAVFQLAARPSTDR